MEAFNVTPSGKQPSDELSVVRFVLNLLIHLNLDLIFKQSYTQLNEAWLEKLGWPLFRAPHEGDAYVFRQFRLPMSDSPGRIR